MQAKLIVRYGHNSVSNQTVFPSLPTAVSQRLCGGNFLLDPAEMGWAGCGLRPSAAQHPAGTFTHEHQHLHCLYQVFLGTVFYFEGSLTTSQQLGETDLSWEAQQRHFN